jgi:hypothetical protein
LKNSFYVISILVSAGMLNAANSPQWSIKTTDESGTEVNGNRYTEKTGVYLNLKGLADGTYYFQVTDPNGNALLSQDNAECRKATIAQGVASLPGSCPHVIGSTSPDGSLRVQLAPFADSSNQGGEYKAWLIRLTTNTTMDGSDPRVVRFLQKDSATDNFRLATRLAPAEVTYSLSGVKFYDSNVNGTFQDPAESTVAGVLIDATLTCDGNSTTYNATTDAGGQWSVGSLAPNCTYSVVEELPQTGVAGSYWVQTSPAPDSNGFRGHSGTLSANVSGLDFGNVCFVPASGGLTLGFWSNKNGQAAFTKYANTLAFLAALPLKKPDGTDFDPSSYTEFRNWLLNGNAVNMAYMLSVQLAATALDVRNGYLNPATIVDASSVGLGYVSIQHLINAAISDLTAVDGAMTFTGNPLRADEALVKNGLDGVNNNRLPFAAPAGTCAVVYPVPPQI